MKESVLNIQNLNFYYGEKQALYNINIEVAPKQVTAFIGPSGCGKSTLAALYQPYERFNR